MKPAVNDKTSWGNSQPITFKAGRKWHFGKLGNPPSSIIRNPN